MADEKTRSRGGESPLAPIDPPSTTTAYVVITDPDSPQRGLIAAMPSTDADPLIAAGKARLATSAEMQFGARA